MNDREPTQPSTHSQSADQTAANPDSSGGNGPAVVSSEPWTNPEFMKDQVVAAIKTCYDPEIPVNIYELGLIYDILVEGQDVTVIMTLTSPMCPVAGILPGEVEEKVRELDGVESASVELVWEPQWTPDRMTEEARLELGFDL